MSNQLISGEYFYKGRINYFLVKCHIYQGNKQIYNLINAYHTKMKYLLSQSPVCCSVWQWQCLSYYGSFSRAAPLPTANTLRRSFSNTRELYSFITINSHINFKESIAIIIPDVDLCQVFMSTVEWGQCLCRQSPWLWHSLLQLRLLWCHYHSSFII